MCDSSFISSIFVHKQFLLIVLFFLKILDAYEHALWVIHMWVTIFIHTSGNWCVTRFGGVYPPCLSCLHLSASICCLCRGSGFPVPLLWAPTAPCTRLDVPQSHALLSLWVWEPQRHMASHTSVCSLLSRTHNRSVSAFTKPQDSSQAATGQKATSQINHLVWL